MPQTPLNIPIGAQISSAITTNTTTLINLGSKATIEGYLVTNAGSAWTVQFYNGNPTSGGIAVGPALALAAGIFKLPNLRFPNGLYVETAGTTTGSMQVAYYS